MEFLKKHGATPADLKRLSEEQAGKLYSIYQKQHENLLKLKDKTEGVRKDLEQLAREATDSTIATTQAISKAGKQLYTATKEQTKEVAGTMKEGIIQQTQVFSNSVQNVNRTVVNQANEASGYLSDKARSILKGATSED
jgi:hypothetical protein